jgi:peptidyl-dipeptidase Dcp
MAWDWRYYQSKCREKHLDFNPIELKPYFQIESIIEAAFYVAYKLFNLEFLPIPYTTYHPDVKCWEVRRNGKHVGVFLGDYFARSSKRSGAWCSSLRSQSKLHKEETPIVVNVCNFAKTGQEEALLTVDDATTLFHEFGHALHNLLSNVTYSRISGTSVARDFVELPSQLFEHWLLTPEVLNRFAKNTKTGKSIPKKLLEKLLKSKTFGTGFETVEYLASAIVDILIHTKDPSSNPEDFQNKVLSELEIPEGIVMRHALSNFSHIFSGDGYSSGYYSYLWSEVMDSDAFEAFNDKNNFFDNELAKKLETFIYGAGGSREPEKLYKLFRGRAPTIDSLLRGRGLV